MGREARLFERTPKVVVGYPVGGSVTLGFHASMMQLLQYEMPKPFNRRLLAKVTHSQGLYVADNRMLIAERFMAASERPEWLVMVDTDVCFPVTLLEDMLRLAGEDKKILAASVPLGAYPSCGFMRTKEPGVWETLPTVPRHPVEVDGIATACCLIHRDVFDAIAAVHGACWFHHIYLPKSPEGTAPQDFKFTSHGEDIAFSIRAAREGFRSWVVHVPGLRHLKTRGLSHDDEMAGALAGEDGGVGELVAEG
jgi:hypothetical protein